MFILRYNMKNLLLLIVMAALLGSCGKGGGLFSGKSKYGFEAPPDNMAFVPEGQFQMGSSDEDIMWAMNSQQKPKTVDAFWMDLTEVTNQDYRRFIGWVSDSIQRAILAEAGVDGFAIEYDMDEEESERPRLNWKTKINFKKNEEQLEELKNANYFYSKEESLTGVREVDARKHMYDREWFALRQAAHAKWDPLYEKYIGTVRNSQCEAEDIVDRSSYIMTERIYIYPETLCSIRCYNDSSNDH